MFTELIIGGESYKLRLTTRASVQLEKALGYNPIAMFMAIEAGEMPKLSDLLIILQAMLQAFHHGYTIDKTYDLFDDYVADGHNMFDLIPVFLEVFQQSGYMSAPGEASAETETKN
jgi:hypothetical protein